MFSWSTSQTDNRVDIYGGSAACESAILSVFDRPQPHVLRVLWSCPSCYGERAPSCLQCHVMLTSRGRSACKMTMLFAIEVIAAHWTRENNWLVYMTRECVVIVNSSASRQHPQQRTVVRSVVIIVKKSTSINLSLIHIWRCRRSTLCRSRWSPYH